MYDSNISQENLPSIILFTGVTLFAGIPLFGRIILSDCTMNDYDNNALE